MSKQKSPWIAVEFVYANGTTGPGEAAAAGEGWCDCLASGGVRFWAKLDGSVDLPMTPVRLAKPFAEYQARLPGARKIIPTYVRLAIASVAEDLIKAAIKNHDTASFLRCGAVGREMNASDIPLADQASALAELRRNPHARRHAAKRVRRALGGSDRMNVYVFGPNHRHYGSADLLDETGVR